MDGLSVVCSARGAADALDAVDWDALCRLLFGTTTRQRRADVFWLWVVRRVLRAFGDAL